MAKRTRATVCDEPMFASANAVTKSSRRSCVESLGLNISMERTPPNDNDMIEICEPNESSNSNRNLNYVTPFVRTPRAFESRCLITARPVGISDTPKTTTSRRFFVFVLSVKPKTAV
jgi:hypothetical protein